MSRFNSKDMTLEERLDYIEFRQELLFYNSEVDRIVWI